MFQCLINQNTFVHICTAQMKELDEHQNYMNHIEDKLCKFCKSSDRQYIIENLMLLDRVYHYKYISHY